MVKLIAMTLLPALWCCMLIGCDGPDPDYIVNVKQIANKRPYEVEAILGKPDSIYHIHVMGKSIFCQFYRQGNFEIQYPDSLATDIIIHGSHGLPFDQTALAAFNLDYRKVHPSDYGKGSYIRWSELDAFSAISFYNTTRDSVGNVADFTVYFKAKPVN